MTAGLSRREKVRLTVAFVLGALALPLLAALFFGVADERVALNRSVAHALDSYADAECHRVGTAWECSISEGYSSSQVYRVVKDGDCWEARSVAAWQWSRERPLPARVEGCVRFRDRYDFFDF